MHNAPTQIHFQLSGAVLHVHKLHQLHFVFPKTVGRKLNRRALFPLPYAQLHSEHMINIEAFTVKNMQLKY